MPDGTADKPDAQPATARRPLKADANEGREHARTHARTAADVDAAAVEVDADEAADGAVLEAQEARAAVQEVARVLEQVEAAPRG